MAAEKVTLMKLKVDLDCEKCYKKVKKVLCKFPQIRDQKYDDKDNTVFITVVCCSPEKIRDKLCCKGGGSIKSIEIVEPPKAAKPPEPKKDSDKPKPKPAATEPEKKKDDAEKPKEKPKGAEPEKAVRFAEPEKKQKDGGEGAKKGGDEKPKAEGAKKGGDEKPKDKPAPAAGPPPVAVPVGMMMCAPTPCYEGRPAYYGGMPAGPGFNQYGGPVPCYDGYYGRPVYDSYGGSRPYYVNNRCDQYFSEENPEGCAIM